MKVLSQFQCQLDVCSYIAAGTAPNSLLAKRERELLYKKIRTELRLHKSQTRKPAARPLLYHRMYQSNSFRIPTPPQIRQLIVYYC